MTLAYEERIRLANDELISKGRLAMVGEIFAPDYILHSGGKRATGTDFVKRFIRQLRVALPDVRVEKVEFFLRHGKTVAWERTLSGTHAKPLKGIPASGNRVEWRDMMVSRFEGEKIAEEWSVSELAGQLLLALPRVK